MRYQPGLALRDLTAKPSESPFVIAQIGQSLDGRIATPTGKSKYISGRASLRHLHRLRASADAVVVGVNTVIADDPQLTVRLVDGRSPVRVIIDPSGRLPNGPRCLNGPLVAGGPHTILVRDEALAARPCVGPCGIRGIDEIRLPRRPDGSIAPKAIVAALAERGLSRVLIEGGAKTISCAIDDGCVDFLHVTVSPMIIGSGTPGIALPPIDELEDSLRPSAQVYTFSDGDALFVCDMRRRRAKAAEDEAENDETCETAAALRAAGGL